MRIEDIREIHRVYNEIVLPMVPDRETLFKTYYLINGINTTNLNVCKRCITSYVMNHPLIEEVKIDKRTKEYKDGKKDV